MPCSPASGRQPAGAALPAGSVQEVGWPGLGSAQPGALLSSWCSLLQGLPWLVNPSVIWKLPEVLHTYTGVEALCAARHEMVGGWISASSALLCAVCYYWPCSQPPAQQLCQPGIAPLLLAGRTLFPCLSLLISSVNILIWKCFKRLLQIVSLCGCPPCQAGHDPPVVLHLQLLR